MAENVTLDPGAGGATIATDEVTINSVTVQVQRVKLGHGADNSYTEVSTSSGLPVQQQGTWNVADASAQGKAAHDAAASGNPLLLGGYASAAAPADVSADGDVARVWTTLKGAVHVADAGGSLTVDGTVTANAGTGTFVVGDGGGSLTVDGTVTANAGTGPFPVGGLAAHDAAVSGNPNLVGGYASAAAPTNVSADGDAVRAWYLRNGAQATVITAAGALVGGDATNGLDVDVTRVQGTVTVDGNIANITASVTPGVGAGNLGKGEDDAHASNHTGVFVLAVRRDAAAVGSGTDGDYSSFNVDANGRLYVACDTHAVTQSGTWTVQPGNTANTTPWLVTDTPATSGGLSVSRTLSAASTNATSVKASAGQVYSIMAHNTNAAVRYLKLYNKASAPTVGTDTPVLTFPIPGNTAGAGFALNVDKGIAFGTGIALALTTGVADADTGAVAANEIVVNLLYK